MAKRKFSQPLVILSSTPGDEVVIGGGTGQSTKDPFACSYEDWQTLFSDDYDTDGEEGTFHDYATWWADEGFSMSEWDEFNPGTPFPEDIS